MRIPGETGKANTEGCIIKCVLNTLCIKSVIVVDFLMGWHLQCSTAFHHEVEDHQTLSYASTGLKVVKDKVENHAAVWKSHPVQKPSTVHYLPVLTDNEADSSTISSTIAKTILLP